MTQFIIVTDRHDKKCRLNVSHIMAYVPVAGDGGCLATIKLPGLTLEVQEDVEAIDRLVRNTDKRSVLANDIIR